MDEIEYLEEFEDIVQTSIAPNSMRSSANNKDSNREMMGSSISTKQSPEISDDDDDSCSYDIFQKLFSNAEEDDTDKECSPSNKKSNAAGSSNKRNVRLGPDSFSSSDYDSDDPINKMIHETDRVSIDSLEALVNDLGEYVPESQSQNGQIQKSLNMQNRNSVNKSQQKSRANSLNSIRGRPPLNNKTAASDKKSSTNALSKPKELLPRKIPFVSMKPQMAVRKVLNSREPKPNQRLTTNNFTKSAKAFSTPQRSFVESSRQKTMDKTTLPKKIAATTSRLNLDIPSTSKAVLSLKGDDALEPDDDPLDIYDDYSEEEDDEFVDALNDNKNDDDDDSNDEEEEDSMTSSDNETTRSSEYIDAENVEHVVDISSDSNPSIFSDNRATTPPPNISDSECDKSDDGDFKAYLNEIRERYFDNIRDYFDPIATNSTTATTTTNATTTTATTTTATTTTTSSTTVDVMVDKHVDNNEDLESFDINSSAKKILNDSSFEQNEYENNTNTIEKVIDLDSDQLTKAKEPVENKKPSEQVEAASEQQNSNLNEMTEYGSLKLENKEEEKDKKDLVSPITKLTDLEILKTEIIELGLKTTETASENKDLLESEKPLLNENDFQSKSEIEDCLDSVLKIKDLTTTSTETTTQIEDIDRKDLNLQLSKSEDLESTPQNMESLLSPSKEKEPQAVVSQLSSSPSKTKDYSYEDSKPLSDIKDLETISNENDTKSQSDINDLEAISSKNDTKSQSDMNALEAISKDNDTNTPSNKNDLETISKVNDTRPHLNEIETISKQKDKDSNDLATKSYNEELKGTSTSKSSDSQLMSDLKHESTPCIQLPKSSVESSAMEPTSTTTQNDSSLYNNIQNIKRRLYTMESDCVDDDDGSVDGDLKKDFVNKKDTDSESNLSERVALERIERSSLELQKQIMEMDNILEKSLEDQNRNQSVNSRRSSVNKMTQKNSSQTNSPQKLVNKNNSKEKSVTSSSISTSAKKERDRSNSRKAARRGRGSNSKNTNSVPPTANKFETIKDKPKEIVKKLEKDKHNQNKSKESQEINTTTMVLHNSNPEKSSETDKNHKNKSEKNEANTKSKSNESATNVSKATCSIKQKTPAKNKEIKEESERKNLKAKEGESLPKNNKTDRRSVSSISEFSEKTQVKNKQVDSDKTSTSSTSSKKSNDHIFEKPQRKSSISESARKIRSRENSSDGISRSRDSSHSSRSSFDEKKIKNVKSSPSKRDYSECSSTSSERKSLEKTNKDAKSKSHHSEKKETVKKSYDEGGHSKKHKNVEGSSSMKKDKDHNHTSVRENTRSSNVKKPSKDSDCNDKGTSKSFAKDCDQKDDIRKSFSKEKKEEKLPQKLPKKTQLSTDRDTKGEKRDVVKEDKSISSSSLPKEKLDKTDQKSTETKWHEKKGGGNNKEVISKPKSKEKEVKSPQKSIATKDVDKREGEKNKSNATAQNRSDKPPNLDNKESKAEDDKPSSSSSTFTPILKEAKKPIERKQKTLDDTFKSNEGKINQGVSDKPILDKKRSKSFPASSNSLQSSNKAKSSSSLEQNSSPNENLDISEKEKDSGKERNELSLSSSSESKKSSTTAEVVVRKNSTDKTSLTNETAATELSIAPRRSSRLNDEIVPRNISTPSVLRETRSSVKHSEGQNSPSPVNVIENRMSPKERTPRNRDSNTTVMKMRTKLTRSVAKNVLENPLNYSEKLRERVSTDEHSDSSGSGSVTEQLRKRKRTILTELEPKTKLIRPSKNEKIDNDKIVSNENKEGNVPASEVVASNEEDITEPDTASVSLNENVNEENKTTEIEKETVLMDEVKSNATITKEPENESSMHADLINNENIAGDQTKTEFENREKTVLDDCKATEKEPPDQTGYLEIPKNEQNETHQPASSSGDAELQLDIKTTNLNELPKPTTTTITNREIIRLEAVVLPPEGTSDETAYDNLPASSDLLPLCDDDQVLPCDDLVVNQVIEVAFSQINENCVSVGSAGGSNNVSGNPGSNVNSLVIDSNHQNDEISKEMAILFNSDVNCDSKKFVADPAGESSSIQIGNSEQLQLTTTENSNKINPDLNDSDPTNAIIEIAKILQEETESMEATEFKRNETLNVTASTSSDAAIAPTTVLEETDNLLLNSLENIENTVIEELAPKSEEGTFLDQLSIKEEAAFSLVQSTADSSVKQKALSRENSLLLVNETQDTTECSVIPTIMNASEVTKIESNDDGRERKEEEEETKEKGTPRTSLKSEKKSSSNSLSKENHIELKVQKMTSNENDDGKEDKNLSMEENQQVNNSSTKSEIVQNSKIESDNIKIASKTRRSRNKKRCSSKKEVLSKSVINTKSEDASESEKNSATTSQATTNTIIKKNEETAMTAEVHQERKSNECKPKGSSEPPSNPPAIPSPPEPLRNKLRVRVRRVLMDKKKENSLKQKNSTEREDPIDAAEVEKLEKQTSKTNVTEKQTCEIVKTKKTLKTKEVVVQSTKVQDDNASTDTDTASSTTLIRSLRNRGVETPVPNTNDALKRRLNRMTQISRQTPLITKQKRSSNSSEPQAPPTKKLKMSTNVEEKQGNNQLLRSSVDKRVASSLHVTRRGIPQLNKELNERMVTRHKPMQAQLNISTPTATKPTAGTNVPTKAVTVKSSKKEDIKVTATIDKIEKAPSADEIKLDLAKKQSEKEKSKKDKILESKSNKTMTTPPTKLHHQLLPKVTPPTTTMTTLSDTMTTSSSTANTIESPPRGFVQFTRRKFEMKRAPAVSVRNDSQNNTSKLQSSLSGSNLSIHSKQLTDSSPQKTASKDITKPTSTGSASSSRGTSKERPGIKKPVSVSRSVESEAKTTPTKPTQERIDTKLVEESNKTENAKAEEILPKSLSTSQPSTSKDAKHTSSITKISKEVKVQDEKKAAVKQLISKKEGENVAKTAREVDKKETKPSEKTKSYDKELESPSKATNILKKPTTVDNVSQQSVKERKMDIPVEDKPVKINVNGGAKVLFKNADQKLPVASVPNMEKSKSVENSEMLYKEQSTAAKVIFTSSTFRSSYKQTNPEEKTQSLQNEELKPPANVGESSKRKAPTTTIEEKTDNVATPPINTSNIIRTSSSVETNAANLKNSRKSLRERVPPVKLRKLESVNNPMAVSQVNEIIHSQADTLSTSSQSMSSEISSLSLRVRKRKNDSLPLSSVAKKRGRHLSPQIAIKSTDQSTKQVSTITREEPLAKKWCPTVRICKTEIKKILQRYAISKNAVKSTVNTETVVKDELDDMNMDVDPAPDTSATLQLSTTMTATSIAPTTSMAAHASGPVLRTSVPEIPTTSTNISNPNSEFGSIRTYSYIHPAKYRSSYGQVQLDYCCPDLAGPMTAIDPTRLHKKIEAPVLEIPRYIVLTTKVIKASEYKKNPNLLPEQVRLKLDRRNDEVTFISDVNTQQTQTLTCTAAEKISPEQEAKINAKQTLLKANTAAALPTVMKTSTPLQAPGNKVQQTSSSKTPQVIAATKQNLRGQKQQQQRVQAVATASTSTAAAVASRAIKASPSAAPAGAAVTSPPSTAAAALNVSLSPTIAPPTSSGVAALHSIASSIIELNQSSNGTASHRLELRRNAEIFSDLVLKLSRIVLSMSDQHRQSIIDNIVSNSRLHPIDFEHGIKILQNYEMWMKLAGSPSTTNIQTPTSATVVPAIKEKAASNVNDSFTDLFGAIPSTPLTKATTRPRVLAPATKQVLSPQVAASSSKTEESGVPIYDVDRNIVGYQMRAAAKSNNESKDGTTVNAVATITMPTNYRGAKQAANTAIKRKQTTTAQTSAGIRLSDGNKTASETNTTPKATASTIRVRGQQLLANNSRSSTASLLSTPKSTAVEKAIATQSNKKAMSNKGKHTHLNKTLTTTMTPVTQLITASDISKRETPMPRLMRRSVKEATVLPLGVSSNSSRSSSSGSLQRLSTVSKQLNSSKTMTPTATITGPKASPLMITALKAANKIDIIEPEPMEESILPDAEDTTDSNILSLQIKSEEMEEEVII